MAIRNLLPVFLSLFVLCTTLPASQWIDMSYKFNNETIYWGDSTRFQHKKNHEGPFGDIPYYSSFDIKSAEHGGTHLDAPIHFSKGKWSVDEIPSEKLVGEAVVVNISAKADKDRNYQLMTTDLEEWERTNGRIPDDSILFVFTDWGKYWPDYEKYMGTNTRNTSLYRFPGIHKNASRWLVENRKVKGVGIDTASIDYGKSRLFETHQILFGKNIYGLENVANLDKLPAKKAMVWALPMNIEGGSGGPVRIFASINNNMVGHNAGSLASVSIILLIALALAHCM